MLSPGPPQALNRAQINMSNQQSSQDPGGLVLTHPHPQLKGRFGTQGPIETLRGRWCTWDRAILSSSCREKQRVAHMCVTPVQTVEKGSVFCSYRTLYEKRDNPRSRVGQEQEQLVQGYITKRRLRSPALTLVSQSGGSACWFSHLCPVTNNMHGPRARSWPLSLAGRTREPILVRLTQSGNGRYYCCSQKCPLMDMRA